MKRINFPIVFLLFAPVALPQAAGPGPAVSIHFHLANAYRHLDRTMEADAETRIGQKMAAKVCAAREPKP